MCLDMSITTATFVVSPERLVPHPRESTGAPRLAAHRDRREHVVGIARNDDAERRLTVVRAVVRVDRAVTGVEVDLAPDVPAKLPFERPKVHFVHARRPHLTVAEPGRHSGGSKSWLFSCRVLTKAATGD